MPTTGECCLRHIPPCHASCRRSPTLECSARHRRRRGSLSPALCREHVDPHVGRLGARAPRAAAILEIRHQCLLFRVHGDRRLPLSEPPTDAVIKTRELRVPIGMCRTFARLPIGLQTVAGLFQQRRHRAITDGVVLPRQFLRCRTRARRQPQLTQPGENRRRWKRASFSASSASYRARDTLRHAARADGREDFVATQTIAGSHTHCYGMGRGDYAGDPSNRLIIARTECQLREGVHRGPSSRRKLGGRNSFWNEFLCENA